MSRLMITFVVVVAMLLSAGAGFAVAQASNPLVANISASVH